MAKQEQKCCHSEQEAGQISPSSFASGNFCSSFRSSYLPPSPRIPALVGRCSVQSLEPNAGVQVAEDTCHSAQQHFGRRAGQKQNLHLCLLVKYARRFSGEILSQPLREAAKGVTLRMSNNLFKE